MTKESNSMMYVQRRERQDVFPPQTDEELGVYANPVCFDYKQKGRIFVEKSEDVEVVRNLLHELVGDDEFRYCPKNLVVVFDKFMGTTYVGKFAPEDLRTLLDKTLEMGVRCFVLAENHSDEDY